MRCARTASSGTAPAAAWQAEISDTGTSGARSGRCGLAGKEGGVFGRDAWAGMSRAGEEAGGATGCGGLRACGSTCGHEAPRPNALADKEAARIERGAWAALRCGDASAARGRAADTPGEKRASHHSEHHWEQRSRTAVRLRLLSCHERAVARRRAGALTRDAEGRRGGGGGSTSPRSKSQEMQESCNSNTRQ